MPKISFIMITARTDFPYLGRSDLHVFEPTIESFKTQTLKDFELIVVDVLYRKRKEYFKKLELPFSVKHIPAHPSLWIDKGLPGISTQYNKGIIYADGELLFFTGDSHMVQPNFMHELWRRYRQGYFALAWYFYDNSFSDVDDMHQRVLQRDKEKFDIAYPDQKSEAPITYNLLGYKGEKVSIEHRYLKAFKNNRRQVYPTSWLWWFGCSSASLEAMLKINGFDQKFDGDRMLLDCDVGSRLEMAGYGPRFALFRNIFLIRAATDINLWNPTLKKDRVTIKCNYPLIWFSRYFERYKANTYELDEKDIDWIKEVFCKNNCWLRETCKTEHPWQYPFEHKNVPSHPPSSKSSKRWFNFWKKHQGLIDLQVERDLRLSGNQKYQEGTFV